MPSRAQKIRLVVEMSPEMVAQIDERRLAIAETEVRFVGRSEIARTALRRLLGPAHGSRVAVSSQPSQ